MIKTRGLKIMEDAKWISLDQHSRPRAKRLVFKDLSFTTVSLMKQFKLLRGFLEYTRMQARKSPPP